MRDGFIKVAVSSPELRVADCGFNRDKMVDKAGKMADLGVKLLAFPEFSLTGFTCNDLFLQDTLLEGALQALKEYKEETKELDLVSVVGMPFLHRGRLYNVAAVVNRGKICGIVPRSHIRMRCSETGFYLRQPGCRSLHLA